MRDWYKLALLASLLAATGCRPHKYVAPESPLPPNTLLLSQMLRQQPDFVPTLLANLNQDSKRGPALMTPKLVDELRNRILGKDWTRLDRFPGWTMRAINPTMHVAADLVTKPDAAFNPAQYLDLGPYALDRAATVSLDAPSTFPPFTTQGIVTSLGDGIVYGDGPNALASEHADSQRLADILNRLAANKLDGAAQFNANSAITPEALIQRLMAEGDTVTVTDSRYFANFTHLHYNGNDVMAPFWIDTGLAVPHAHGRHLLVPVSHAELEWHIRGPRIHADISYYFGIDGKAEWRTMDTLDQPWVLHRDAHTYTGAQAVEATRLGGLFTSAYLRAHAAHPALPFGGYYALGVCQDAVSALERALTGRVTLFPNTVDTALFTDPRDAEANALLRAIPHDRDTVPTPDRIFGSLPAGPENNFSAITIPGLATDLAATYATWQSNGVKK